MTAHAIEKLHAVAVNNGPLTYVPANLNASAIVGVLGRLGLMVPTGLSAAAAKGEPLRASGHRILVKEIDAALGNANVTISDRFRLKAAMIHNGILER